MGAVHHAVRAWWQRPFRAITKTNKWSLDRAAWRTKVRRHARQESAIRGAHIGPRIAKTGPSFFKEADP